MDFVWVRWIFAAAIITLGFLAITRYAFAVKGRKAKTFVLLCYVGFWAMFYGLIRLTDFLATLIIPKELSGWIALLTNFLLFIAVAYPVICLYLKIREHFEAKYGIKKKSKP